MQDSSAGNARLQPGSSSSSAWHSRGYMPHFDSCHRVQHVTYHLADSLPSTVLARLEDELRSVPESWRDTERRRRIDDWVDAGHGCCLLREPVAARVVQDAFLHFDGVRYRLHAWVVMPNHVHVLFQVIEGWTMAQIVTSWKSFTGRRLAAHLPGTPLAGSRRIWHREYWDRFIRDDGHFVDTKRYVYENPVKAGLVDRAVEWEWSSARLEGGGEGGVGGEEKRREEKRRARLEPGVPGGER